MSTLRFTDASDGVGVCDQCVLLAHARYPFGSCHSSACAQAATLCTQVSATPAPVVDAPVLQRHALGLVVSPSLLWMHPFLFCLFVPSARACRSKVAVTSVFTPPVLCCFAVFECKPPCPLIHNIV